MDLLGAYDDDDDDQQMTTPRTAAASASSSSKAASSSSAAAAASSSSSSASHTVAPFPASASSSSSLMLDTAPDVPLDFGSASYYVNPQHNTLFYNPRVEEMYSALQGPRPAGGGGGLGSDLGVSKNHQLGFVEPLHMSNFVFEDNYHKFINKGVAANPTAVKDADVPLSSHLVFSSNRTTDAVPRINPRVLTAEDKVALKLKRKAAHQDAGDLDSWQGPWASRETQADEDARKVEGRILTPEQQAEQDRVRAIAKKRKGAAAAAAAAAAGEEVKDEDDDPSAKNESTTFHGTSETDYQGRTYMHPPSTLHVKTNDLKCYLPKRLVHTFTGHQKGVNAIKFFPNTGHLLLSASNDKTVKIWNVVSSAHGGYKCLRTFSGHTEGVRGIDFNYDGSKFMTCSFDKYVKYWDTETGQCISRHTTKKIPYCVRIHPDAGMSHEVLIGQHNKLIVTLDLKSNEIVQSYNEHLGPVNSVTFIDGNRRFVSTSGDASPQLFVWEYGIPVVIKRIAEPDMHSMPYVAVHPSQKFFVGQSQDNQILCFTAQNKYKLKRVSDTHMQKPCAMWCTGSIACM
jgi:pre-mRNA-processing factor 17